MNRSALLFVLLVVCPCCANSGDEYRQEAEYYVDAYAEHYNVPVEFVRALVEQESGWQRCPTSRTRAMGLMQLMPDTARRLNVHNRCDLNQNVSGGVRYLAWLISKFHGDLRLVAAAYYAGEREIEPRGLRYSNSDVVGYVVSVRKRFERQKAFRSSDIQHTSRRTP